MLVVMTGGLYGQEPPIQLTCGLLGIESILSGLDDVSKKLESGSRGPRKLPQRLSMLRYEVPRPRDLPWDPRRSRVLMIEKTHAAVPVVGVENVDRSDARDRRECIDAKARFLARFSHRGLDG